MDGFRKKIFTFFLKTLEHLACHAYYNVDIGQARGGYILLVG